MGEDGAGLLDGQDPVTSRLGPGGTRGSAVAIALGGLGLVLTVGWVPLTYLTGDLQASRDGVAFAFALVCGLLGMLVARRQPRNPEGWLLLGLGVGVLLVFDSGLYAVLDYRFHHGRLPLGETATFLRGTLGTPLIFAVAPVILLFPDGRLSRRWTWLLRAYVVLTAVVTAASALNEGGTIAGEHIRVSLNGTYEGRGGPTGLVGGVANVAGFAYPAAVAFWPAFAARQAISWRRATGDRRQQLKWLMSAAAAALVGLALVVFGPANTESSGRLVRDLAFLSLCMLPISIGVGILKYHLYDIDRLISRTVSYTLVTGLLVGVYASVVTLTTRVLPFSSPVGVAASTLAAASLFNPLRRRVQRLVDRRFNRAHYDAEATVAAFAARLQDAVDLDSVRDDLSAVVQRALEPASVSVWMSERHG